MLRAVHTSDAATALECLENLYGDGAGAPPSCYSPVLQVLLRSADSSLIDRALHISRALVQGRGAKAFDESLLSLLVRTLVSRGRIEGAKAVAYHAAAISEVRMRTFRPLMQHYAQHDDQESLWDLYHFIEDLSARNCIRFDGEALAELLSGLDGARDRQQAVLAHYASCELSVPLADLEEISARVRGAQAAELLPIHALAAKGELDYPSLQPGHVARVRAAIEQRVSSATLARLQQAVLSVGGGKGCSARRATCVVDGANVGYTGASQRCDESRAPGDACVSSALAESTGQNPMARFFRHDQIADTIAALEAAGQVPLVLLPERYVWRQVARCAPAASSSGTRNLPTPGPGCPACELVRRWLAYGQLLVVPDAEPDDLVWMYATLLDLGGCAFPGPAARAAVARSAFGAGQGGGDTKAHDEWLQLPSLFAVTRDKALDHRNRIWGTAVQRPELLERERAWRRWKALRVRWYEFDWADGDHFSQDITVTVDWSLPWSTEIRQRDYTWYLPDESGSMWLRLQL